ncbi:MAG TPA: GGDEF domain-containing protein, partial [Desulfobacteria bacterium]|nr:GGDEF domain-containing protein [Desulfobacteria bacterium]
MSALKMPWKAKVLIVLCYLLPLVIDTDGTRELIWMLLLIPAIFLAYFQGLKGGLSAASIGAALELGREAFEYFVEPVDFSSDNLVVFVVVFLTTLLSTIGIGILCDKLRKAIDEAEYLAFHDDLSGLPNRRLFADRLALALSHARRNKQMVAVMFLDLDRFKNVNDTMGHSSGDLLIKGVANRWKACLREEDTLSRLGGDEFTILLDNVSDADGIVTVAKRIMASLEQPFKLRNKEINISASAGIAVYPRDGQTAESLMQHADAAMYQAKESGVNTYLFFSQDMNATVSRKVLVEENMRKAFELEEFRLNYQAQVNLK